MIVKLSVIYIFDVIIWFYDMKTLFIPILKQDSQGNKISIPATSTPNFQPPKNQLRKSYFFLL